MQHNHHPEHTSSRCDKMSGAGKEEKYGKKFRKWFSGKKRRMILKNPFYWDKI